MIEEEIKVKGEDSPIPSIVEVSISSIPRKENPEGCLLSEDCLSCKYTEDNFRDECPTYKIIIESYMTGPIYI